MTQAQAMEITRGYEGCRLRSYRDSLGNRTIGYGHLQVSGDNRQEITQERAAAMFGEDYAAAVRHVVCWLLEPVNPGTGSASDWDAAHARARAASSEAKRQWEAGSIDPRHAALFDGGFNLGGRLGRFKGLRAAWHARDFILAGDELVFVNPAATPPLKPTPYAEQVGRRARDNAYRIRTNREPVAGRMA